MRTANETPVEPVRARWPLLVLLLGTSFHFGFPWWVGRSPNPGSITHVAVAIAIWAVWRRFQPTWGSPLLGAAAFVVLPWSVLNHEPAAWLITGVALVGVTVIFFLQRGDRRGSRGPAVAVALVSSFAGTAAAEVVGSDPLAAAAYLIGAYAAGPLAALWIDTVGVMSSRRKLRAPSVIVGSVCLWALLALLYWWNQSTFR